VARRASSRPRAHRARRVTRTPARLPRELACDSIVRYLIANQGEPR
jgi:hypothetical protein